MFSSVLSASLHGLSVELIDVEADVSNGLPMFHMVGYLSSEVKEAGDRVRTAIRNSGFFLPAKKIVVNLSPADKRKRGTLFDLSIAIAVLISMNEIPAESVKDTVMIGELSLDGGVKGVAGVLPVVLEAKKRGIKKCIVPSDNLKEAHLADGIEVIGVSCLKELCGYLKDEEMPCQRIRSNDSIIESSTNLDFSEIKGQYLTKRAVEVAVAGNHNILMIGPPGAGKTAIAKRIPSILPPLSIEESMELTMIYSVMGKLNASSPLMTERPFRQVHQSVTKTALLGGGIVPRPGEISLANKGVLFLDEIAEFQRSVLETLRQPLEDKKIKIIREKGEYDYPAEFLLVAAMNPCPCGNYPDLNKCNCTAPQIQQYLGKISHPFLERIDLCVEVEKLSYDEISSEENSESSDKIRERVVKARKLQEERYEGMNIKTNSQLGAKQVEKICVLDEAGKMFMKDAFEKLDLTARSYHKTLCVARTIADLDGCSDIGVKHLREAMGYRTMNKKYWG